MCVQVCCLIKKLIERFGQREMAKVQRGPQFSVWQWLFKGAITIEHIAIRNSSSIDFV